MKDSLKLKFTSSKTLQDPIVLSFRLPSGSKLKRTFSAGDFTKVSYHYANVICIIHAVFLNRPCMNMYFVLVKWMKVSALNLQCHVKEYRATLLRHLPSIDRSCMLSVVYSDDVDIL